WHGLGTRDPMARVGLGGWRRRRGRDDLDLVPAAAQKPRQLGRVARRPADVRRPDPGDDQDPHKGTGSVEPCCRWMRAIAISQATANTPAAISAAAAP